MTQEQTKLARVCLHGEAWPCAVVMVEVPRDVADDQIEHVINEVARDIPKREFQHVATYMFDVGVTQVEVLDQKETAGQRIYRIRRNEKGAWELAWN